MVRNTHFPVTILKIALTGESNRLVTYLTGKNQIATSTLYGGPKSKLRSLVSPFHAGTLYIYTDPVRKTSKITDFDVSAFRPSLREDLYKNWAATLCSELVLKTFAGGQVEGNVFALVNGFLDGLDLVSENESRIGTLRFLWRYLGELGLQPDVTECFSCGTEFDRNEESESVMYSAGENGFLCEAGNVKELVEILKRINELSGKEKKRISQNAIDTARELSDFNVAKQYINQVENA